MALSVKQVERIKEPGRYGDGHGLYLRVTKGASKPPAKSWVFRYIVKGREHQLGLGPVHTVSLDEARDDALKQRKLLREHKDPIAERERAKQAAEVEAAKTITFWEAAEKYYEQHNDKWTNEKYRKEFRSTLDRFARKLANLPIAAINRPLVLQVIEPIWKTKTKTADKVRRRIENVLDWAKVHGYRDGENPATWEGNLQHALPAPSQFVKVKHHNALPYVEIADFMAALAKQTSVGAKALTFLILTAARRGEVNGARWDEIKDGVWTIPAARTKTRQEHTIPLSDAAIAALPPRRSDFIFPGMLPNTHISEVVIYQALRDGMGRKDITVHGFRSTFRDWAAERATGYANHVVEMALAHTVPKVEAAYRRTKLLEQRARLMTDWARYCSTPEPNGANVTPLRARA